MRQDMFGFVGNLETLLAVGLGAVLATAGGLFAAQIEHRMSNRRREREAARFFGEILSTMHGVLAFAFNTQKIGDPWGPVTLRMFRTAMREAHVYERNRERLFDVGDTELRARIHRHFLEETVPLEAMIDNSEEIARLSAALEDDAGLSPTRKEQLKARIEALRVARKASLDLLVEVYGRTGAVCERLEKIADVKFGGVAPPVAPPAPAAAAPAAAAPPPAATASASVAPP